MSKLYMVVDPDGPQTSGQCLTANWDLCVVCQKETVEMLKCPANSARGARGGRIQNFGRKSRSI